MSQHDDLIRLQDMLDYAREAVDLSAGHRRDSLANDRVLQLALARVIEIIGEAASRVSDESRQRFGGIPWIPIIGMRNQIVHAYGVISLDLMWNTITDDLPPLITALEAIVGMPGEGLKE